MKSLIIGGGSIGIRHKRLLEDLGHAVFLVSEHAEPSERVFNSIDESVPINSVDYIIIANETFRHE